MMMEEDVRSPMFAAQPFEESQGVELSPVASPQALDAFYKDMEIKETLERQLSKRSRVGTNIWSRKSAKRSSTAPPVANTVQTSPSNHQRLSSELETNGREAGEWLMDNQDFRNSYQSSKIQSPRSILPDSSRDPWSSIPLPGSTKPYNIHNPLGPRWYKNHHLIPPGDKKPTARPPTFFSPSFPGMTTSSQERFEEGQLAVPPAGPSRTPSGSPLPTPTSSQTRVFDGMGKPRIRKTSQTAHDNVDLMDPTDPWGTHWHHKSPYDIGLANEPISIDLHGAAYSRGRRASMTTQSRSQSMKPSPLSQSTSAVNLSTPRDFVQMPRKLSKRRTANGNIFGGSQSLGHTSGPSLFKTRPASVDSARPPMSGYHPSMTSLDSKKEKRGSFLNRLGRKLSLLRRRSQDEVKPPESIVPDEWHHVGESFAPPRTSPDFRQHEPEPETEPERQSPPPEQESIPHPEPELEPEPSPPEDRPAPIQLHDPGVTPAPPVEKSLLFPDQPDQQSILSVEAHFSIGKLTVANPDAPESEHNSPAHNDVPLPEPTPEPSQRDTQYSTMSNVTYMTRNSLLEKDILLNLSLEKTLPPPPPIELTPNPASISLQHNYTPQTTLSTFTQAHSNLSTGTHATQASSSAASFTTQATVDNGQLPGTDSKPDATPGPSKRASQQITNSPAIRSVKSPESFSTAPLPPFAVASPAAPSWVSINLTNFDTPPVPNRISLDHTATPPPPASDKRSSHRPSPIPFPTSEDSLPTIPSVYDYSPYSATSVLANPPTPSPPRDIPVPKTKEKEYKPSPLSQPQNNHTRKKSTHANNHDGPSVTRLTETFKLVRNPSGNVQTRNTATMAGGDQWEVVGSALPSERNGKEKPAKLEKKRDKSVRESRVTESRGNDSPVSPISPTSPIRESREREKKRESRSRGESENREHRHDRERSERSHHDHSSREQREREYAERERLQREREYAEREREKREREYAEREYRERQRERERRSKDREREKEEKAAAKEHKSRDRDRHRDSKEASSSSRQESRHTAEASSSTHREREHRSRKHDDRADKHAAEAAVAAVKARGSSPDNLVRRTSSSTRPTSQLPSAAELNALRAREAWEMERLWKARSINGESSGFAISGYGSPNFAAIDGLIPTGVIHGTNHTTFVVQAPFIPNNTIYHSMPQGPPPIVYPAPPPVVTKTTTTTTTTTNKLKKEKASKTSDPERKQRKHHSVSAVPAADSNKPLPPVLRPPNPLPAPPRDSFHDAKPFPQMNGTKRSSENWTPVAGVTLSN